jgi:ABC-2 type transport system ATP-binding protein
VYFDNLFKSTRVKALEDVSLTINRGDCFAMIGQNGAGKSTAMYCLLGLIKPQKGSVTIDGMEFELGSSMYNNIGYLPEEPHYHDFLTIDEALYFYSGLYNKTVTKQQRDEILGEMGLFDQRYTRIKKCSKGMKQKLGIAQAIITEPDILFLDEPTRGLDPIISRYFKQRLINMKQKGSTIIINSHVLSEVESLANRAVIIDKGRVVLQDELINITNSGEGRYQVEYEGKDVKRPAYLKNSRTTGALVTGSIPEDEFHEFMMFLNKNKLKLHKCLLNRMTLEDSFFNIIKGDSNEPSTEA